MADEEVMKKYGINGWFDQCETIEQLNRERTILISNINAAYGDRKEVLLKRIPAFKTIPMVQSSDLEPVDTAVYVPFPKSEEPAPPNSIVFNKSGEISY